jgi:hypothetical protein
MKTLSKPQIAFVASLVACKLHQNNEVLVEMEADTNKPFSCDVFGAYIVASKIKPDAPLHELSDMDVPYFEGKIDECPASLITLLCLRDGDGSLATPWKRGKETFATLTDANDAGVPFDSIAKYIKANPENVFVDPNERAELDKKTIKVHVNTDKPKAKKSNKKADVTPIKAKAKAKTKAAQVSNNAKAKAKAKVKPNVKAKAKVKSPSGQGDAAARKRLLASASKHEQAKSDAVTAPSANTKGQSKATSPSKATKQAAIPKDLADFMN